GGLASTVPADEGCSAGDGSSLQLRSPDEFTSCFEVAAPADPALPFMLLVAPTTIGCGQDLTIDGSASTGGGGRPLSITWTQLSGTPTAAATSIIAAANSAQDTS
ncbi:unnamed protein product, partial [Chrysoparadoxa australica]